MVSLAQRLISLSHSGSAASRYSHNYINRKEKKSSYLYSYIFFLLLNENILITAFSSFFSSEEPSFPPLN